MFEIGWSELLILVVVTLLFVGPKELPVFLRTIGRYAGVVRRHAGEFRAQFDAAMREAEVDAMKDEMKKMQDSVNAEVMAAEKAFKQEGQSATALPGAQGAAATAGQPGSFTAAAASAVFPASAPLGQVYVRPSPEEAAPAHGASAPAAAELPAPSSVPMPAPANPES
ncbi:MAG TPA: Sec-independent protein translocase protein TatB [Hyphomicrobium sp.]|nr:Sec-independent protein translocase protein TatB [Hyphomicrobium sp.]